MDNLIDHLLRLPRSAKKIAKTHLLQKGWNGACGDKCAIIIASYNTAMFISHLLFSLLRILDRRFVARIIVVDNGSTDTSLPILRGLRQAGLIDLIENRRQRYHGPALNQGIDYLNKMSNELDITGNALRYILILDSDTVVLRSDLLDRSIYALEDGRAVLAGQFRKLEYADFSYAHISSLLFKPHMVWQRGIVRFDDVGEPGLAMQKSIEKSGLKRLDFPFMKKAFVLHLGEGTLRSVYHNQDKTNKYYKWSAVHHEHHYHGVPYGRDLHDEFLTIFNQEVGNLTPASLLQACSKSELIRLELPWMVASQIGSEGPGDWGT